METVKKYFIKNNLIFISEEFYLNGFLILVSNKEETKGAKEISETEYNSILRKRGEEFQRQKLEKLASSAEDLNFKRKKKEEVLKRLGISEEEVSLFF